MRVSIGDSETSETRITGSITSLYTGNETAVKHGGGLSILTLLMLLFCQESIELLGTALAAISNEANPFGFRDLDQDDDLGFWGSVRKKPV